MTAASRWTDARLTRLFERYRLLYWPESRRLKTYRVRAASLERETYGRCDPVARVLHVDVSQHPSDRELRATVLHEMIHAVVGRDGHHAPFWTQLEYLLSRGAPTTVSFPELGERGSHLNIIPARFRRCRRLFRPIYRRWQREVARVKVANSYTLTPTMLETECEDMAVAGGAWRAIWAHQVSIWGFVDLDGRLLAWAKAYQLAARRGYVRGRRLFLEEERRRAQFADARSAGGLRVASRIPSPV